VAAVELPHAAAVVAVLHYAAVATGLPCAAAVAVELPYAAVVAGLHYAAVATGLRYAAAVAEAPCAAARRARASA
jgi:hypothetical protein